MSDDKSIWTSDNVYLIGFLSSVLLSVPQFKCSVLSQKKFKFTQSVYSSTLSLLQLRTLFIPATYSNTQQHKRTLESSFIELLQLNWLMF